jgi:hypothetical protein
MISRLATARLLRLKIIGLTLLVSTTAANVYGGEALNAEINHLLTFIRTSGCHFIRNDQSHDGHKAESHIKRKYGHFKERIKTAEDFIAYAATRSTVSGRLYRVRCKGQEWPTHEWLQKELSTFRKRHSEPSP